MADLLEEMGLTRKEIEIYDYLLSTGGSLPSAIARDTGHPRGRIYEGMRNLVAKGFVRERPTRPILFCPTPLADVLAAAQARLTRHLQVVRHAQAAGPPGVRPGGEVPPAPPMRMRDVRVVSGRRACYAEIARMIGTASRYFWMSGGGRMADRLANMPNLWYVARSAAGRGVDVRIIVPRPQVVGRRLAAGDDGVPRPLLHQLAAKDDVGPFVSCVNERSTLEMIAQPDDDAPTRGDDVAIQIADALFAARLKRRLDRHFVMVQPTAAPSVFPWLGPNHGSDIFGNAIRRATNEVKVLGPAEWGTYMRTNWGIDAAIYQAAVRRGVNLRAVASTDAAAPADLAAFQESWKIRVVPQIPMWLTIIDGREVYQAFPHASLGGLPQFRRSEEPHEIGFYEGIFERLWDGAPTPIRPTPPQPLGRPGGTRARSPPDAC